MKLIVVKSIVSYESFVNKIVIPAGDLEVAEINASPSQKAYLRSCSTPVDIQHNNKHGKVFSINTGLPLNSSPAPLRRTGAQNFDFDENLLSVKSVRRCVCALLSLLLRHVKVKFIEAR